MTEQTRALLDQVLRLPVDQRAAFAEELLASLDADQDEIERHWVEEVRRRAQRARAGKSEGVVDWDDLYSRLKARTEARLAKQ